MIVNQLNPHTLKLIDLPEEIWNVICHELTISELNIFQFVSKKFYQIANNPLLWIDFANKYNFTLSKFQSDSYKKKELFLIFKHGLEKPNRSNHAHVARMIGLVAFDNLATRDSHTNDTNDTSSMIDSFFLDS